MIYILLNVTDSNRSLLDGPAASLNQSLRTWHTIFGWVVHDNLQVDPSLSSCFEITGGDDTASKLLQHFWEQEEVALPNQACSSEDTM